MTAEAVIGECSSCARGSRRLDPDTGACGSCLTRYKNLVEFFRLVREGTGFKSYARARLSPSKRETFNAMFGTDGKPELVVEVDDGKGHSR